MKEVYIYNNYPNVVVLQGYLDVIKRALDLEGFHCEYIQSLNGVNKKALIIFPMGNDAFKYYLRGFHNIIMWQQGVTAEESYMRHKSSLRRIILNFFDCFSMKRAKMIFYVSKPLQEYYEKKAHTSFEQKSYIMPCFNEELQIEVFKVKDYSKYSFAYVGSLSVWQCFEKTVRLFKGIQELAPDSTFKVLTFQTNEAIEVLQKYGIKNYVVKSVPQEMVKAELQDVNYGFIIREDCIVNKVATPTKISSYLAAGVLPIFSDCLIDFCNVSNEKDVSIPIKNEDENQMVKTILSHVSRARDKEMVVEEISGIFSTYYSIDYHVEKIRKLIDELNISGDKT